MLLSVTGHLDDAMPSGEQSAAEVYRTFSRRVTGLCRHMLRDRESAEDAASEVFLRLRDGLATYDRSVPLERWLLRITANHCIDVIRRRKLERRWVSSEEVPLEPPSGDASPLTLLLLKERRGAVDEAINNLEEAYRVPLVLRYYADLGYDEIAVGLGLEKTQVAGRIFRAKQMLRAVLKENS